MIKLDIAPDLVEESKKLAISLGTLENSISKGAGNRAGILGELTLARFLGAKRSDKRNHDLIYKKKTIEVKTKRRTEDPKGFYEASVAETSSHQHPDYYAFLSLTFEKKLYDGEKTQYAGLQSIWLCGFISYDEFTRNARLLRSGYIDESNGFAVITDMYNLRYDKLKDKI